jgi:hypothetical protein
MDPNANLAEQARLWDSRDRDDKARLTELRVALYEWMAAGGFAPDWPKQPYAAVAYRVWVKFGK